jgi:uncharacterized protein (DUF1778 family)
MDKVTIGLKVTDKFKERLLELANRENRNLSNWILNAILTYAEEHMGIDPTELKKDFEYSKKR